VKEQGNKNAVTGEAISFDDGIMFRLDWYGWPHLMYKINHNHLIK
jgi:hypothetical protein